MSQAREKFVTQVSSEILSAVRVIAERKAASFRLSWMRRLADLIEKRKQARSRLQAMAAYLASHDRYGELYKKLAK